MLNALIQKCVTIVGLRKMHATHLTFKMFKVPVNTTNISRYYATSMVIADVRKRLAKSMCKKKIAQRHHSFIKMIKTMVIAVLVHTVSHKKIAVHMITI